MCCFMAISFRLSPHDDEGERPPPSPISLPHRPLRISCRRSRILARHTAAMTAGDQSNIWSMDYHEAAAMSRHSAYAVALPGSTALRDRRSPAPPSSRGTVQHRMSGSSGSPSPVPSPIEDICASLRDRRHKSSLSPRERVRVAPSASHSLGFPHPRLLPAGEGA